jgi:acetoin utilization deacetylase AcuC-like enzyme
MEALEAEGILGQLTPLAFRRATDDQLALVHDPAYVDLVRMMCDSGFRFVGSRDTCVSERSYDVSALAAGGVLAACDAVMHGEIAQAFCAVRPPGHHAEYDQALGFCLFNYVALAAEHLVSTYPVDRVAIVDFDVHHGNGTQHFFEWRSDVLYVSIHERPGSIAFPGTGEASEQGRGSGAGFTLNVPLNRGCREDQFLTAVKEYVVPALAQFAPQFLLLSAGFDGLMWDNVSSVSLEPATYETMTCMLLAAARPTTAGRMVSVLEGGYDLGNLGKAVACHIRAMLASVGGE